MSGIVVSSENLLEQESFLAIQKALHPWKLTRPSQGDDFGRDAFVQIVEEQPGGSAVISPLAFALQAESTAAAFKEVCSCELSVRHLDLWCSMGGLPMVVFFWSRSSDELRWRMAHDIVRELDSIRPTWREQKTVQVPFTREQVLGQDAEARGELQRRIADECDRLGGVRQFHQSLRRVLLTDLYSGPASTSETANLHTGLQISFGTGWEQADIDPAEVFAPRVLAGSLFLYEEIWYPFQFTPTIVEALGIKTIQTPQGDSCNPGTEPQPQRELPVPVG